MSEETARLDRVWRHTLWSFYFVAVGVIALIIAVLIDPAIFGDPPPEGTITTLLIILAGTCVVTGFCRLIYGMLRRRAAFYESRK